MVKYLSHRYGHLPKVTNIQGRMKNKTAIIRNGKLTQLAYNFLTTGGLKYKVTLPAVLMKEMEEYLTKGVKIFSVSGWQDGDIIHASSANQMMYKPNSKAITPKKDIRYKKVGSSWSLS